MEARVEHELNHVLRWARAVSAAMEREPHRRDEFQTAGHAYIGGVLTTLDHLELVTPDEHAEWRQRLNEVLGDPPGGWIEG
jgi:hypothetical protein